MHHKQILFQSIAESQNIHAQIWLPDGEPKFILQVVHGIMEYGGRYASFAQFLTDHGAALAVHDHMGHGETALDGGQLGCFAEKNGWKTALLDTSRFSSILQERYPRVPLVLLGHSMGSFMVRCLLIEGKDDYAAAILSGTAHNSFLRCGAGRALCSLAALRFGKQGGSKLISDLCFKPYAKKFPEEKHAAAWLTRDEATVVRYGEDPFCRFLPSVGMFREIFGGMHDMEKPAHYRKIRKDLPLLMISGADDPVGSMGKGVRYVYRQFQNAGLQDVELRLYPNDRHEILNELDKDQVYEDIWNWLLSRIVG